MGAADGVVGGGVFGVEFGDLGFAGTLLDERSAENIEVMAGYLAVDLGLDFVGRPS